MPSSMMPVKNDNTAQSIMPTASTASGRCVTRLVCENSYIGTAPAKLPNMNKTAPIIEKNDSGR